LQLERKTEKELSKDIALAAASIAKTAVEHCLCHSVAARHNHLSSNALLWQDHRHAVARQQCRWSSWWRMPLCRGGVFAGVKRASPERGLRV
jgi:hypothetical protein